MRCEPQCPSPDESKSLDHRGHRDAQRSVYVFSHFLPQMAVPRRGLKLDRGLIDQHDRDVVLYRVNPVALRTFQAFRILAVLERLLTGWTNQHF